MVGYYLSECGNFCQASWRKEWIGGMWASLLVDATLLQRWRARWLADGRTRLPDSVSMICWRQTLWRSRPTRWRWYRNRSSYVCSRRKYRLVVMSTGTSWQFEHSTTFITLCLKNAQLLVCSNFDIHEPIWIIAVVRRYYVDTVLCW